MATVLARISLTVQDKNGPKVATPWYLEVTDTQTVAQVMAEMVAFAGLIEAVTDGLVVRQSVSLSQAPASQAGKPGVGSFVSRIATLSFDNSAHRAWGGVVPSILDSKVSAGKLIETDTDVAALIGHIEGSSAPLLYTDPNGLTLTSLKDSFLGARKHRRAQHSESVEYP